MLNLPMTVGSSFKPGEAPEFYDVSDGVLSMYIMGDPFCEMFGQHYSKPYPKEVLQDAAKLAVDQALLLKSLGIDGIIIGNTRFLSPLTNKRKEPPRRPLGRQSGKPDALHHGRVPRRQEGLWQGLPDLHQYHRARGPGGRLDAGGRH